MIKFWKTDNVVRALVCLCALGSREDVGYKVSTKVENRQIHNAKELNVVCKQ